MPHSPTSPALGFLFKGTLWLLVLMIFGMIVIGGVTRLTGSGLSIVEWAPIGGILPPLSLADWQAEFLRYQSSPEFMKVNSHMLLEDFKGIFWLEYIHRLWGRVLGVVLLIPTILALSKESYKPYRGPIGLLWVLGFGQGVLGWLMVKSGLIHDPHVSPFRLAAHLMMGVLLLGLSLHLALGVTYAAMGTSRQGISLRALLLYKRWVWGLLGLFGVTLLYGALVAGHKAGLVYNTFPMMGEGIVPHELFFYKPWWKDLLENPVTIQFVHRVLAVTTFVSAFSFALYHMMTSLPFSLKMAAGAVGLVVLLQLILGILTLLYAVPVLLGALHQAGALFLFMALVGSLFWVNAILGGENR